MIFYGQTSARHKASYKKRSENLESNLYNPTILHHIVQRLTNKLMKLSSFFNTGLLNLYVLCFSEHWLTEEQMKTLNTELYKLADYFSKV
jgi:hypothetical protein